MELVWWPGRSLGSRTLRFGDKGTDVNQLHEFLRLQGYDLGEEEEYGYLTKDAVRQFQRDHGLVADGIAGKRFFALVLKENLPIRRRVHVVQPQETLAQIAQTYGVGVEAFSRSTRKREIYPGQRLVFFDREVWGRCTNGSKAKAPAQAVTGVVCVDPSLVSEHLPCVVQPLLNGNADEIQIHNRLKTPKRRKKTASYLVDSVPADCGLFLPWKEVPALDGVRYIKLLSKLRNDLPKTSMLWVELGPGVPPWRLSGGVDYARVNELVDRIVLDLPVPEEPASLFQRAATEELLHKILRHVHSWKILLNVPIYALEWELTSEGTKRAKFPYSTALSRAFRHGARLKEDEQGELFYYYQSKGRHFQIRLPHHASISQICALANSYNLAGVILDELGQEDPRIWQIIHQHFRTAKLNISAE
ncbi:MAG: hypothetical protein GX971_15310 [Firmicutes bacterium]|nr:hypothetical protein [Bacillota bacterium]